MFCVTLHVLDELSYTFDHIWINLLTQCTSVPVLVFCYFSISGSSTIKSAPKIPEKSDKKSARRNLPETPGRGQRATTRDPGALVARPRGWPRQGGAWLPGGPPGCPPSPIYYPLEGIPNIKVFSRSRLCTTAAVSRSGLLGDATSAPCRNEEPPPGDPPSPWTPPGCALSSPPWTMGP